MATSTATVFALSMLSINMVTVIAYFIMAFMLLYFIGWALIQFIKPILRLIQ